MGTTAREVIFRIIGDTDSLVKGYDQAAKSQDEFKKKTEAANKILGDIAKTSALVVTAVAGVGIALGKMASDFNKEFSLVETLIPGATDRILELKKNVQELSVEQNRSTSDLSDGLYQVISAYGDSADAAAQLGLSSKAAVAGASTTTDAINLLAAVTKGYGDSSLAAQQKVADLSFITTKVGQTTFPELAQSIQQVVPLSKQMGISLEEMFNVYTTGTGVIGNASEVSTKYKATLVSLMKPTDDMAKLFTQMGVANGDALIAQNGFVGALERIKTASAQAGIPMANLFESSEAITLALSLTGAQASAAKANLEALSQSSGALDEAYDAATTGLNKYGFELGQAQQAATVFGQRLGDQVLRATEDLLVPVTKITSGLASLDDETLATIVSFGTVVVTAAATAGAVALLSNAVIGAAGAWRMLGAVMSANPLGVAVVGIVTAITLVSEASKRLESSYASQISASRNLEKEQDTEITRLKGVAQEYQSKADKLGVLTGRYTELEEKAKTSKTAQAQLQEVIRQISQIAPDAVTQWDKFGNAIEISAGKAKSAQGVLNDIARQELQLAILKGEQQEKELRAESASLDKWLTANRETIITYYTAWSSARQKLKEDRMFGADMTAKVGVENSARDYDELVKKQERYLEVSKKLEALDASRKQLAVVDGGKAPDSPTGGDKGTGGSGVKADSQGGRLLALDAEYQAEKALAQKSGEDIYAIEKDHLAKRKELLETFVKEDVANKKSEAQSLVSNLAGWSGQTIGQLIDQTNAQIKTLSSKPIASFGLEANVKFQTDQGVRVEEALKTIRDEAKKTSDDAIQGVQDLARQEASMTAILKDGNITESQRQGLTEAIATAVKKQTELGIRRTEALNLEAAASSQLLAIDLDRIGKTTAKTNEAIEKEIAMKKELGLLGTSKDEIAANELKLRANALQEKQNALKQDYSNLVVASKDETNKAAAADASKAEAVKAQIKELQKEILATGEATKAAADVTPMEKAWQKVATAWDNLAGDGKSKWKDFFGSIAELAQAAGDQIQKTFSGIASIATGLISNEAERQAQDSNAKLAKLEQDKNAALTALDDELTAMKKAHAEENEAIAEAEAEATYQAQQTQYQKSINELQTSLDQETNITKAKALEKELEAARKAKREAQEAKKKEKEDKARADKQTAEENAILNQRSMQEWNYATQKVQIENAAGTAAANAAKEKAKWDKASTVLSLSLLAAQETANAAASFPNFVAMGVHASAAVIAGVQAGVAATAPEPSGYIVQPIPPPPVLLAAGGIFLPTAGGTAITTSGGTAAKVAEAGVPEVYLPLTVPNLQTLFQAAGISTAQGGQGFYYAPVYELHFTENEGTTKEEVFDYLKNDVSRELMEVVEDAKRKFFVGS